MYTVQPSYGGYRKRPIKIRTYLYMLLGLIVLVTGIFGLVERVNIERSGIPVDLKIIRMIEDTSQKKRGYAPEFKIIEGKYAGKISRSRLYEEPPLYKKGDRTKGKFDPVSGRIRSEKNLEMIKITSAFSTILGAFILSFSVASYYRQSHRLSWRQ